MSISLPQKRNLYTWYYITYIFIHSLFQKLLILTQFSPINLFTTLLVTILLFSKSLMLTLIFSLSMLLLLPTTLLQLLLLLILYTLLLLSKSVLDSTLLIICDNNVYISI